ncbi:MAG: WbqC family protein [Sneathiella sp.]
MRVAIVQSNYIPWKGYFDLIASVDRFVLYDDMQFTRRDWRNRNKIKTPQGLAWLTVPVLSKGKYFQTIKDTQIDGAAWAAKHWKSIEINYARAPYFEMMAEFFRPTYEGEMPTFLSELNTQLIRNVCEFLNIDAIVENSADYDLVEGQSERLVDLCKQLGADVYVSGPLARDYLDTALFLSEGIKVEWFDYSGYPVYDQLWGGFEHGVSILDLIANTGLNAPNYMKNV